MRHCEGSCLMQSHQNQADCFVGQEPSLAMTTLFKLKMVAYILNHYPEYMWNGLLAVKKNLQKLFAILKKIFTFDF